MELQTADLLLRTVTERDTDETARMWEFEKGEISADEARKAIEYMQNNHRQNRYGHLHLFI